MRRRRTSGRPTPLRRYVTRRNASISASTNIRGTVLMQTPELAFWSKDVTGRSPKVAVPSGTVAAEASRRPRQCRRRLADDLVFGSSFGADVPKHHHEPDERRIAAGGESIFPCFHALLVCYTTADDHTGRPSRCSVNYPDQTRVHLYTQDNVFVSAANKLWLTCGLALGATTLIAMCGMLAVLANGATYSNKLSALLRLARGAQLGRKMREYLKGRNPLPSYAKAVRVSFRSPRACTERRAFAYAPVGEKGRSGEEAVDVSQCSSTSGFSGPGEDGEAVVATPEPPMSLVALSAPAVPATPLTLQTPTAQPMPAESPPPCNDR